MSRKHRGEADIDLEPWRAYLAAFDMYLTEGRDPFWRMVMRRHLEANVPERRDHVPPNRGASVVVGGDLRNSERVRKG